MNSKKIVGVLVIIALFAGGYQFFQRDKHDKALSDHNNEKFQKVRKAAQKSSTAGLLVMASAINKYHKKNGNYPEDLNTLYPEFIPDKSFISTLNFSYTQGKGTYLIKRNVKGSQTFSSIGPDLRLKTGKLKTAPSANKIVLVDNSKPAQKQSALKLPTSKSKPNKKNILKKEGVTNALPSDEIKKTSKRKLNDRKIKSKYKPEFNIVEKELNSDETFLLSLWRSNLYIWKDKDGIIGFSNYQYPDGKNLSIYRNKVWVEYQYGQNNNDQ